MKKLLCLLLLMAFILPVAAAEVDCDTRYCFSAGDFSTSEDPLRGVCITGLPEADAGTVMLGRRVVRTGDILTVDQLEQLTFTPLRTEQDLTATICYLPVYENRVEQTAALTINIRGKENLPPTAEDSTLETYKNLPNEGKLKVKDPEGECLTYTLLRKPRRGDITLRDDGTFIYTPKKNKVGVDSFTYTATDASGKVSREATVTVQVLKPTDSKLYTDTAGLNCRFEAQWLRNTGLFAGETVSGQLCFQPEKTVSRGEFVAMVVRCLEIPMEELSYVGVPENTPQWLRPYLAAANRAGLMNGWPDVKDFGAPITGAEAAVLLNNALDLIVEPDALVQVSALDAPEWATAAVTAMTCNGLAVDAEGYLTRADMACLLYDAKELSYTAPGMNVIRKQQ